MKLISVIVPTYNLAAYVFQCVSSITQQTYPNLEIIVVDDGSSDSTIELCEFFRKTDARIKIVRKPNGGLVSARKAGVGIATGDYVFYVDGDDWIDPDCIRAYYDLAVAHDADVVIGDYKREFLGDFVTVRNNLEPGLYDRAAITQRIFPKMVSQPPFFQHGLRTYSWGKLYRRSLIQDLQDKVPDNIVIAEDACLLYPAMLRAERVYVSDLTSCNYRQRPNSILKSPESTQSELSRISLAFNHLAQALGADFTEQLQAYFLAITLTRTGALLCDTQQYQRHQVFGEIPVGSKLAIYNSGSFGQQVYKHLKINPDFALVAWYDPDYPANQLLGMSVSDPAQMDANAFDLLLVPSFDPCIRIEVEALIAQAKLPAHQVRFLEMAQVDIVPHIVSLGFSPITFLSESPT